MFLQFCQAVLSFLDIIAGDADREEYVLRAAVGVVGDLASRLGDKLGNEIKRPAVRRTPTHCLLTTRRSDTLWCFDVHERK
jgi:hypothetical protein